MSKEVKLNKELYSNLRDALEKAVTQGYITGVDTDKKFVITERWVYNELLESGSYHLFKQYYTYSGQVALLIGEPELGLLKLQWEAITVEEETYEGLDPVHDATIIEALNGVTKSLEGKDGKFVAMIKKHFGGSNKEVEEASEVVPKTGMIIKQFDEEERIAYEPLYCPPDTADGHDEGMTKVEIVKMVDHINDCIDQGIKLENIGHKAPITKAFEYKSAFVSPWPECTVGDTVVKEGQPVLIVKYHNQRAWELRKEGRICGPSIGGTGIITEVDEDE